MINKAKFSINITFKNTKPRKINLNNSIDASDNSLNIMGIQSWNMSLTIGSDLLKKILPGFLVPNFFDGETGNSSTEAIH